MARADIAGHDHCSGHYEEPKPAAATVEEAAAEEASEAAAGGAAAERMLFVLAGAGKECCYAPSHLHSQLNPGPPLFRMDREQKHGAIGGFASYVVTATATTVRYHDHTGAVLYTAEPLPPRTQQRRGA